MHTAQSLGIGSFGLFWQIPGINEYKNPFSSLYLARYACQEFLVVSIDDHNSPYTLSSMSVWGVLVCNVCYDMPRKLRHHTRWSAVRFPIII